MQDKIVIKYGLEWHPLGKGKHSIPMPDIAIERAILADYDYLSQQPGAELDPWKQHFMRFVDHIWGELNPKCKYKYLWNPSAERMLDGAIENKLLALSGHASSGKTQFGAIWGVANFLIYHKKCKVMFTSTSIKDARARIWGVVERYWNEACDFFGPDIPGKLVSSESKIVGFDKKGRPTDMLGCSLIASGDSARDAQSKIGFKADVMILVADELPLMQHELFAATCNLLVNQGFQMLGIGNLTDIFDPFGDFAEPADGWDAVNEEMDEWPTKRGGLCLRFNGEKSPNVVLGYTKYHGLLSKEYLELLTRSHGYKSAGYYKMVLSFPCPNGDSDNIYSANEFVANECDKSVVKWVDVPQKIAFLDPAFTSGGDRAAIAICEIGDAYLGNSTQRRQILKMIEMKDLMLQTKAGKQERDINEQLAELFIKECNTHSIPLNNRGIDATGGGTPFASILAMKQGHGTQLVSFAGSASEKIMSNTDRKTGKDRFTNKVSELWYVGKEFVKSGQIRGLSKELMQELCNRKYKLHKDKIQVESKKDLKKRAQGKSCDFGDAWVGCIEIARERFGFMPASKAPIVPESVVPMNPLEQLIGRREPQKASLVDIFGGSVFSGGEGSGWAE